MSNNTETSLKTNNALKSIVPFSFKNKNYWALILSNETFLLIQILVKTDPFQISQLKPFVQKSLPDKASIEIFLNTFPEPVNSLIQLRQDGDAFVFVLQNPQTKQQVMFRLDLPKQNKTVDFTEEQKARYDGYKKKLGCLEDQSLQLRDETPGCRSLYGAALDNKPVIAKGSYGTIFKLTNDLVIKQSPFKKGDWSEYSSLADYYFLKKLQTQDHKNQIVPIVYDGWYCGQNTYILMEKLDTNLNQVARERAQTPEYKDYQFSIVLLQSELETIFGMAYNLGLLYGIQHGDLKLDQFLVKLMANGTSSIKLTDFGFSGGDRYPFTARMGWTGLPPYTTNFKCKPAFAALTNPSSMIQETKEQSEQYAVENVAQLELDLCNRKYIGVVSNSGTLMFFHGVRFEKKSNSSQTILVPRRSTNCESYTDAVLDALYDQSEKEWMANIKDKANNIGLYEIVI